VNYRYFWATFKEERHIPSPIIVRVDWDDEDGIANCDMIGSDDVFDQDQFDFLEEIKPYQSAGRC
jgi:hypothetical protein